jgi:hypothetical protein
MACSGIALAFLLFNYGKDLRLRDLLSNNNVCIRIQRFLGIDFTSSLV